MTVTAASPGRFDMGRVISAGFGLFVRRPVPILVLALLFGYLPTIGVGWLTPVLTGPPVQPGASPDLGAVFGRLGLVECVAFVAAGFGWLLQGGVAIVAVADALGESADIASRLTKALGHAPLAFLAGVTATVGIVLGTFLLVVPGVLLSLAWSVGPAVAAVEDKGFLGVFRRSAELTRGCRWALLGIMFLFGLAASVLNFAARLLVGLPLLATNTMPPPIFVFLIQPAVSAVTAAVTAAVISAAYLELRGVKEGGLAAVFD
ncbi:MAG: hypothetical protein WDM85_15760 [Caulobacteraceae bacterium]